jgi:predicted nuclease with TOPRIM domain
MAGTDGGLDFIPLRPYRAQFMTTAEIQEIKALVLRELPAVLAQDTEFALVLEGMLSERFPRRDEFARLLEEMKEFRSETKERFEQVDKRFEQVDKRLEHIDQQFEDMKHEIHGLRDWMQLNVGGFQTRAGKRLEDVVAGAFCYGLNQGDIRPEHVKLRQKITDVDGWVYRAGKTREVDIIALGQNMIVFEVKSTADHDDIDDLADKVELVRHLHPENTVEGILVMLGAERDHRDLCAQKGLKLIP